MPERTIAIIGARGHHHLVLRELPRLDTLRLVAVCSGGDTVEPLLQWAGQHQLFPSVFEDYRTMLDEARPDIVAVVGPFEMHAQMCIDALDRRIHVLTEKPAATTIDDLERLADACARNPSVHLAGMMQSRYDPAFFTAAQLIRAGAIGQVRLVNARKSYRMGRRPPYYSDRRTYGGTIPWVGSHAIDWVMWYTGGRFQAVHAWHSRHCNAGHGEMEATAAINFLLPEQVLAQVSLDVLRPDRAPTHADDWVRIVGSAGVIEIRGGQLWLINADRDGSAPMPTQCDRTLMTDFLNHLDGSAQALIDAPSTICLTRACLLARQSADEGRLIVFPRAEPED